MRTAIDRWRPGVDERPVTALGAWRRIAWRGVPEHTVALALLAALMALTLLGAVTPQQTITPPLEYARWRASLAPISHWLEAAGFTASANAPWLPAVATLLAASLARCTVRRTVILLRLVTFDRNSTAGGVGWSGRGANTIAFAGSVGFHAALMVGLVALALSAATRFVGHAELAPHASLVDQPDRYLATEKGWLAPASAGLTVRLDDIELAAWPDGSLKEHSASLSVLRDGGQIARSALRRGEAFEVAGLNLRLDSRTGPAARLVAITSGVQRSGWIHFPAWPAAGPTDQTFTIPGTQLHLLATIDGVAPGAEADATLTLRSTEPGAQREWRLRPGETVDFGAARVSFAASGAWTGLTVTRDRWLDWAFGAGWFGLVCLALTALGSPKSVTTTGSPAAGAAQ